MLTNKDAVAVAQGQLTAEVVLLIQPSSLDQAREMMAKSLHSSVKKIDSMIKVYYSCQPPASQVPCFSWELIKDSFLEFCSKAKVVILPPWVQIEGLTKGEEELAKIAEAVVSTNPEIQIFAFLRGGTTETAVHRVKNKKGLWAVSGIRSFADPTLIKALQTI